MVGQAVMTVRLQDFLDKGTRILASGVEGQAVECFGG
jgi:hypothetical protein